MKYQISHVLKYFGKDQLPVFFVLLILIASTACTMATPTPVINNEPEAFIDTLAPTYAVTGESISFAGHGTDKDGSIAGYSWRSSIDGVVNKTASFNSTSLSVGSHTIYFKVQDNAGAWSPEVGKAFTVALKETTPPVINDFSVTPADIIAGSTAMLRWNISKATVLTIDQEIGSVPATGEMAVTPKVTTMYTLTAKNSGGVVTSRAQVFVKGSPIIASFSANPSEITIGGRSVLTWDISNALNASITPDVGTVEFGKSSVDVSPTATTRYVLTATNTLGSSSKEIEVKVTSASKPVYRLDEYSIRSESGTVRQSGEIDSKNLWVGDDDFNKGMQCFFSFDISKIPNNASIRSVTLDLRGATEQIHPFTLGKLRVYNDQYEILDGSDFKSTFPDGTANGLLFTFNSPPNVTFVIPQYWINRIQQMANEGTPRFQIRLQFERFSNDNSEWDFVRFNDTNPKLTIEYIKG